MAFNGLEWLKTSSLTAKLAVSILGSVFCGVVALLLFFEYHSTPILNNHITEIAEKSLQKSVTPVVETAIEIEQATTALKNSLSKFSNKDEVVFESLLQSIVETMDYKSSNFGNVWVYVFEPETYRQGTLFTAENLEGEFHFERTEIQDLYNSYPWFKEVPKEEKIFWTEPYIDVENPNKPVVTTCIIPFKFKNADDFNGLISISIYLDKIQKEISQFQFHENGKFLLFSRKGLYLVHPSPEVTLHKTIYEMAKEYNVPQLADIGKNMLERRMRGHLSLPKISGPEEHEPVIFFYMYIPHINWGMGLFFPQEQFFEPIRRFQLQVSSVMLLVLLILFALISYICHYSTKPLLDLSKIAEQYGRGDFSTETANIYSTDEIGVVSRAFHNMRGNLLKLIDEEKKTVAERQKAASELEIAQKIQKSALPVNFPVHPNFEIYASMEAAQKVGGDFYDFFFTDEDHVVVLIADVAGKGIPAALYMMTARSIIKTTAQTNCPTAEIFNKANNELCNDYSNDYMFLTAFLAKINIKNGYTEYVCAGHNPPFLYSDGAYKEMKVEQNFVLGAIEGIKYKTETLQLHKNDRIFLYTDGVTEAQNINNEMFGEKKLENILQKISGSAEETLLTISQRLKKFTGGALQSDDITMLEFIFNGKETDVFVTKAEIGEMNKVLEFVEDDMKKHNIGKTQCSNMLVAVGEAFSNIASYAYKSGGMVLIERKKEKGYYHLIFKDRGKKFNPLAQNDPDITGSAEERNIGGLGIYMIKQMTDVCNYEYVDGCNIFSIGIKI